MMVYAGAEQALELVPWHETSPAFHVEELNEFYAEVRIQIAAPHVYYVGAHEGCGCGFQLGEYGVFDENDQDELQETRAKRVSLEQFASYLAVQLQRVERVELFACWAGDEGKAPEHSRRLTPASLLAEDFYFLQSERSVVERGAAQHLSGPRVSTRDTSVVRPRARRRR